MMERTGRIDERGRLTVPSAIRRELQLETGSTVILTLADGGIRLLSRAEHIRRVQEAVRRYVPPGRSLSQELIAQRRGDIDRG